MAEENVPAPTRTDDQLVPVMARLPIWKSNILMDFQKKTSIHLEVVQCIVYISTGGTNLIMFTHMLNSNTSGYDDLDTKLSMLWRYEEGGKKKKALPAGLHYWTLCTQPHDDTSANVVYDTPSLADAETGADSEKSNSEADTKILNVDEEQGEDVSNMVALEESILH
ncbi:hypothetical protein Tco_1369390 [Tanacetum coccineum]